MRRRLAAVMAPVVLAAGLVACGGDSSGSSGSPDYELITPPPYMGAAPLPTPDPSDDRPRTRRDVRRLRPVIAAWADAVRRGDPARATGFFALPAIVYQPSYGPVEVRTRGVAEAFNRALPCGARLIRARP